MKRKRKSRSLFFIETRVIPSLSPAYIVSHWYYEDKVIWETLHTPTFVVDPVTASSFSSTNKCRKGLRVIRDRPSFNFNYRTSTLIRLGLFQNFQQFPSNFIVQILKKYSKSNSPTFLPRCIKITFACCTWEMLTFFLAVFNVSRDIFKKRDASSLLYVAEKDRCTVCDQFCNNVRQIQCEKRVLNYVRSNF